MFYVAEIGGQHLVSLKTGRIYYFTGAIEGQDWQRAAQQLEQDDMPAPAPEPEPDTIVRPSAAFDYSAQTRMALDEIKLSEMRK